MISPKKPSILLGCGVEFILGMCQKAEPSQVHVGRGQRLPVRFHSSKVEAAVRVGGWGRRGNFGLKQETVE